MKQFAKEQSPLNEDTLNKQLPGYTERAHLCAKHPGQGLPGTLRQLALGTGGIPLVEPLRPPPLSLTPVSSQTRLDGLDPP